MISQIVFFLIYMEKIEIKYTTIFPSTPAPPPFIPPAAALPPSAQIDRSSRR